MVAAVALLLAAACVDPEGPEERFGQVNLRATFATGETPADFGVAVDSMRVLIQRDGEAEALVDTVIAYVEGDVASWVLDLVADEELLAVDMQLRGGSAMLYDGSAQVTARAGEIGEVGIQGVPVLYRGPAATDRVVVTPGSVTLAAIGDQVPLQASALARDGSVIDGKTFAWNSSVPAVVTVDDQGVVTAVADGTVEISATVDGVSGIATVTVQVVAAAVKSTIDAAPADLLADGIATAQVTVLLFDANGYPLGKSGGVVTLATSLGTLGAVTDHGDGSYTASLTSSVAGAAVITGSLDGTAMSDDAVVTFHPGTASPVTATVTASPATAPADSVSPVTITVRLFDGNGNPLTASGGTVVLGTTLGGLSPVTDHQNGSYSATLVSSQVGTALVSGLLNGIPLADTAAATFTAGPASPLTATLRANPRRVAVDPIKGTTITVRLFDSRGNPLGTSGGTVALFTTLGTLGPVVDHGDGTYTATLASSVAGTAFVTGTLNGVSIAARDDVHFVVGP
jgi:adhesin/invasin